MTNLFVKKTLTTEEFGKRIARLMERENRWRIGSNTIGSVFVIMTDCKIDVDFSCEEFIFYKSYTDTELRISFKIVESIVIENECFYCMEFNIDMADIELELIIE